MSSHSGRSTFGYVAVICLWLSLVINTYTTGTDCVIPTPHLIKQRIHRTHYLGSRVAYYANSDSTFQLLLIAGDVQPNPGPTKPVSKCDNHLDLTNNTHHTVSTETPIRKTYDSNQLKNFKCAGAKPRIPRMVWRKLLTLGISVKKPTRRGSVGGKRNRHNLPDDKPTTRAPTKTKLSDLPIVFMTNSQSVVQKKSELGTILRMEHVDVLVLTETWFTPDMLICQLDFPGFITYSKCRPDRRGGGVTIYVKDSIASRQLNISVPDELECILVEVKPHRLPRGVSALILCSVYITIQNPLCSKC